jgi:uncharacterized protein YkwD
MVNMTLSETMLDPLVVRCRIVTSRRVRRRPVLPVLVAVFVGASVAGVTTVVGKPVIGSSSAAGAQDTSFTYANRPPNADRQSAPRPAPPGHTATTVPTTTTPATTTTPPVTTTTVAAPPNSASSAPIPVPPVGTEVDQVVTLVNQARLANGCAALRVDDKLTAAASDHSTDMSERDYFSHTTPEGVTFDERIANAGYAMPGAENIAKGQDSAAIVMDAWMKSKGHRNNILNCQLTAIGVGLATDGWYWTQDFGF